MSTREVDATGTRPARDDADDGDLVELTFEDLLWSGDVLGARDALIDAAFVVIDEQLPPGLDERIKRRVAELMAEGNHDYLPVDGEPTFRIDPMEALLSVRAELADALNSFSDSVCAESRCTFERRPVRTVARRARAPRRRRVARVSHGPPGRSTGDDDPPSSPGLSLRRSAVG